MRKNTFDFIHWQHSSHFWFAAPLYPASSKLLSRVWVSYIKSTWYAQSRGRAAAPCSISQDRCTDSPTSSVYPSRTSPSEAPWATVYPCACSKMLDVTSHLLCIAKSYSTKGKAPMTDPNTRSSNGLKVTVSQGASCILQDLKAQFCQKRDYFLWEGKVWTGASEGFSCSFLLVFNCTILWHLSAALHYDALHRAHLWQFTLKD